MYGCRQWPPKNVYDLGPDPVTLTLKIVSPIRKMYPCEQSLWDWVPVRWSSCRQGWSSVSSQNSMAVLPVMCHGCSTTLELCTFCTWFENCSWLAICGWVWRSYADRGEIRSQIWTLGLFVWKWGAGDEGNWNTCVLFRDVLLLLHPFFQPKYLFGYWVFSSARKLCLNIKQCSNKGHISNNVIPSLFRVLSLILNGSNGPKLSFSAQTHSSQWYYCGFNY